VSVCLDLLYFYSTDIFEVERAHVGPIYAAFDPPAQGGKIHKDRDCAQ
jgi:hypothetical protein